MKKLLILGAGTAGTIAANKLRHRLNNEWAITLVDPDPIHFYQPGYLFMPFGIYERADVVRPKSAFLPGGVSLLQARVGRIEPDASKVYLEDGRVLPYDFLIIATGADIHPEETPGLAEHEWGRSIHTFYSCAGAETLATTLQHWRGGRMVVNVVENPIKCPVAPLEFLMLADWFFREKKMRDRVELIYATPLPGAFTKPKAAAALGHLLAEKGIRIEPDFLIERVDPDAKSIVSFDERKIDFDLLVSVPLNKGAPVIGTSSLGDELNYVRVGPRTLLSNAFQNVFALGDAANTPASKAGSVAHFQVDTFVENFLQYIAGHELKPLFDGHANCFIESGNGKGLLIDFNYDTEPLPGRYPLPHVGPFSLLEESSINHWGKLAFRWIYWNLLLQGRPIPLPAQMSMLGKIEQQKHTTHHAV